MKRETLREDIVAMRERMRAEHGRPREGQFDLKQDRGGIADIEFLAQYWVLRHVREHPPLAEFADTIRHLESVGSAALVDHRVIDRLVDAYRAYRERRPSPVARAAPGGRGRAEYAPMRAGGRRGLGPRHGRGRRPRAAIIPANAAASPAAAEARRSATR